MSLRRGLDELYGQAAFNAVMKEMKQIHDQKTIRPTASMDLTLQEKRRALSYLMFINEKHCGTIKVRGCAAGGKKQWLCKTKKRETSSPTVLADGLTTAFMCD